MTDGLPESWVRAPIGEICLPVSQRGPSGGKPSFRYIDLGALDSSTKRIVAAEEISVRDAPSRAKQVVKHGDVIFSNVRVYLENIALVPSELDSAIASTAFCVLRPAKGIDPRFLYYFVTSRPFVLAVNQLQRGNSPPSVQDRDIRSQVIPVAPESEQKRIASRIDELFSRIDEGGRALERLQTLLERYRHSVVKAAVTGELTREWREKRKGQIESGEALLRRILRAHREAWEKTELHKMKLRGIKPSDDQWKQKYVQPTQPDTSRLPDLPAGWIWVTFQHVAECLDYAREPVSAKVRSSRPGTIPYYGANGQVGTIDKHIFDEPLILVVEDETFTGRTKPFSYKIEGKSWVNNHAHVLRPTQEVEIDFLNALLMRYPFIPLTTGTTGRRKLTQKALLAAPVAVPPKSEQVEICSALDTALSSAGPTSRDAQRAAVSAAALRQAILLSAFKGQLINQDQSDEPASALFDRIATERDGARISAASSRRRRRATRVA